MTWYQRYRIRQYVDDSIWPFPVLSALLAVGIVYPVHWLEDRYGWVSSIEPETARTILGTLTSALLTAIVFICSALLVAVQLASAALTPRIIGIVFRDPVTKFSLTLLVFTYTFSVAVLLRIEARTPLVTTNVAVYGCLVCTAVFFYLIDHLGKALRPSGALRAVAHLGFHVIESVYPPRPTPPSTVPDRPARADHEPLVTTIPSHRDGVVMAFDDAGLLALARRAECVIELVPQVGDFVAVGDPLFRVGGKGELPGPGLLRQSVAIGQERTLKQDPTFVFRIMVDIASKALSPAINDPTTAVLALDQIHRLLRKVAGRDLDTGTVRDETGRVRLVFQTPDWTDFVRLAVTEIRHFGGMSIQVARRLRAMLVSLVETLPEDRAAQLRDELSLLHRTADRFFAEPEDRAFAEVGDLQGVGGKHAWRPE